jgi:N utilization substance protein B
MMVLYKADVLELDTPAAVAAFEQEHEFELAAYAHTMLAGIDVEREAIDTDIQSRLSEWTLDRLGAIERAILRVATWELQTKAAPVEVVINEAVELAKRYASPEAARLVNGVLGSWAQQEQ